MTGEPAQYIKGKTIQEQMMQILKMLRDQADAIQEQIDDLQRQIDDIGAQTIAPIVDGTTPAMRAIQDESGNNIEQTYATLDSLTDGSVTKVGTANVGTDTKPIKLVGGVPTAVTNDLVDVSSAQTITEQKNFRHDDLNIVLSNPNFVKGTIPTANKWCTILFRDPNNVDMGYIGQVINTGTGDGEIRMRLYDYDKSYNTTVSIHADHDGNKYMTIPYRAYNSANVNDAVTIGSLAANPNVVHTTGNETVNGLTTFILPIVRTDSRLSTAAPATQYNLDILQTRDSNNTVINSVYMQYRTDGSVWIGTASRKPDNTYEQNILHQIRQAI